MRPPAPPLGIALLVAVWAGVTVLCFFAVLNSRFEPSKALSWLWITRWSGLGAGLMAWVVSGWIGGPGLFGWVRAFGAAALCTLCGGFLGGTMVLPGIGTIGGTLLAAQMIVSPEGWFLWWGGFGVVQFLALWLRRQEGAEV